MTCPQSYVRANGIDGLSDEEIDAFFETEEREAKIRVKSFWTLKNVAGHVLERLVLLDRQIATKGSYLYKLFDAKKSPRCVCVSAIKKV